MFPVKTKDGKGLNSSENQEIPRNPGKKWKFRAVSCKKQGIEFLRMSKSHRIRGKTGNGAPTSPIAAGPRSQHSHLEFPFLGAGKSPFGAPNPTGSRRIPAFLPVDAPGAATESWKRRERLHPRKNLRDPRNAGKNARRSRGKGWIWD